MFLAQLLHHFPGTRLWLPGPILAWLCLIAGGLMIAAGTVGAMKVRRHMMQGADGLLDVVVRDGQQTLGYLVNEYDEEDKWLLLLGLIGRVIGGLLFIWGPAGLVWA